MWELVRIFDDKWSVRWDGRELAAFGPRQDGTFNVNQRLSEEQAAEIERFLRGFVPDGPRQFAADLADGLAE